MKTVYFLLVVILIAGCNKSEIPVAPKLGTEFELKYGKTVVFNTPRLVLKFKYVSEDSRCPSDVICKWEGNARVKLQANSSEITLNTTLFPKDTLISGYKIRLTEVFPYPQSTELIKQEDYSIRMVISKE